MSLPFLGQRSPRITEEERRKQLEKERELRLNDPAGIDHSRASDIPEKYRAEICWFCGKIIGWRGHWLTGGLCGPRDCRLNGFGFARHLPVCHSLTNGEFYKNLEGSISKLETPIGFITRQIRWIYFDIYGDVCRIFAIKGM